MDSVPLDASTFVLERLTPESFTAAGRRDWWEYRDLMSSAATGGQLSVRTARSKQGCEDVSTGWHYHTGILQMGYVISGWVETAFEGKGVLKLEAGTFLNLPIGTVHNELRMSPNFEMITFSIPGELGTVPVDPPDESASSL